jgi:tetratricopeptide (TPR) repeat protein
MAPGRPFAPSYDGAVFWKKKQYDRAATIAAADKARGRGRLRKAISGYAAILSHDPDDHQVHARIAPLLARKKRFEQARKSFDAAGNGFLKAGFSDKAIAVWTVAAHHLPEDVEYWERIADEQVRRGRKQNAIKSLLDGRSRLRAGKQRPLAILLLRQVLTLQPLHFEATLDLAKLVAREGSKPEAAGLLRMLVPLVRGGELRQVRAAQFWLAPNLQYAMGWLLAR